MGWGLGVWGGGCVSRHEPLLGGWVVLSSYRLLTSLHTPAAKGRMLRL